MNAELEKLYRAEAEKIWDLVELPEGTQKQFNFLIIFTIIGVLVNTIRLLWECRKIGIVTGLDKIQKPSRIMLRRLRAAVNREFRRQPELQEPVYNAIVKRMSGVTHEEYSELYGRAF